MDGAKRPALAVDDRLYAWAPVDGNGLRVVAFDRARGRPAAAGVGAGDVPRLGERGGRAGAVVHDALAAGPGPADPRLGGAAWYSGPHATPQAEADARRRAEGQVRIDVATGKVETAAAEKPARRRPRRRNWKRRVIRWQGATGGGGAALVLDEADGRQKLSLWLWDAGKVSPPRELLTGKRLLALPTIHERLLCLRDASPSPDEGAGPGDRGRYGWSLFFADSGERLPGPYDAGTEGVAVVGQRAFFLVAGSFKGPINRPFVRPRSSRRSTCGRAKRCGSGQSRASLLAAGAVTVALSSSVSRTVERLVYSCHVPARLLAFDPVRMKIILRFSASQEANVPILLRHSPGMVLPGRTYVLSEDFVSAPVPGGRSLHRIEPGSGCSRPGGGGDP